MTGKEKCEILRSIRRQIAKTNNILFPAWMEEECTYRGNDCKGTCPKCESEIRYLEDMLNVMVAAGMKLRLSGISADAISVKKTEVDPIIAELEPIPEDWYVLEAGGRMVRVDDWNNEDI